MFHKDCGSLRTTNLNQLIRPMKITLALTALALTLTGTALAEDPAKKAPAKGKGKGLLVADADGDKKVSLEEFKAHNPKRKKPLPDDKIDSIFKKKDADGDGFLAGKELEFTKKKPAGGGAAKKKPAAAN